MKLKDLAEKYGEQEVLCWAERADESLEWVNIKLEPPKPKTVWDLVYGDKFIFINAFGDITENCIWEDTVFDEEMRSAGNVFLTKEEAEQDLERRKIEALLLKYGGRRWFRRNRYNYYMWLNTYGSLIISSTSTRVQGVIYFDTEEQAQNAINGIGEERIKKALFEVIYKCHA